LGGFIMPAVEEVRGGSVETGGGNR
jgi:hypothetical protein